jgi:hypothetical protein
MSMTTSMEPLEEPTSQDFPRLTNLSAAYLKRLVLVPKTRPTRREYIRVPVSRTGAQEESSATGFFFDWGNSWESGGYRVSYFDPEKLRKFVPEGIAKRLEEGSDDYELHLVPDAPGERQYAYDGLYHLLPLRTLKHFRLPIRPCGFWPAHPVFGGQDAGSPAETTRLRKAFAHHIWPLLSPASPLRGFSDQDSLVMLAHDLDFWFPYLDQVIESELSTFERCEVSKDDYKPETIEADRARAQATLPANLDIMRPRKGGDIWRGEELAWETSQQLVELADARGRLRGIIDTIRSAREHDDFSPVWSNAKEDFERRLYRKRSRVRVTFVELDDTPLVHGPEAEQVDTLLWKNLMAMVDPKDRRVIVCLRSGHTRVGDIAADLGYRNHSPVSKALQRIRALATRMLGDDK